MNRARTCVLAVALIAWGVSGAAAQTVPAKGATIAAAETKPNKAALEAMLSKCSEEADAKGLSVRAGKGEQRKLFRRECMRRMGVEPR